MHAVVVRIKLDPARDEEAVTTLNEFVVPASRQAKGFKAGYWTRSADKASGVSVEIFETEADARAFADGAATPPGAPATLESVEVMEVMASA